MSADAGQAPPARGPAGARARFARILRVAVPGLVVLAAGAWGVLQVLQRRAAPPPPPAHVATQAETYALLIGCGEYPYLRRPGQEADYERNVRLRAPSHDVALLADTLERYLGVPRANIEVLVGWPEDPSRRPTAANLLGSLERLARRVRPGAHVVFHFSGHGVQQADEDGDEPDGCDELLMAADTGSADPSTGASLGLVRDDDLAPRLRALREAGATVWAILDCCHSGTAGRGAAHPPFLDPTEAGDLRVRGMDPERLGLRAPHSRRARGAARGSERSAQQPSMTDDEGSPLDGVATFAAAHDDEEAVEMTLPRDRFAPDRAPHGLLTFAVVQALRRHLGELTLAELGDMVREEYRRVPWHEATPLVAGDRTLRAGTGRRDGASLVLLLRRAEGRLCVDAGALRGMTPGSVLEVFRPGRLGVAEDALGRVVVERVEPLRAWLAAAPGGPPPDDLPDGAPARLLHLAPGGEPFALAVVEDDGRMSDARDLVVGRLFPEPAQRALFLARAPWDADCRLRPVLGEAATARRWLVVPGGPDADLEPIEADDVEVPAVLERLRRAAALRRAARSGPLARLPEGITIDVQVQGEGRPPRPWQSGMALVPGERIDVRVTNATGHEVDVALQSLDAAQNHEPLVKGLTLAREDSRPTRLLPPRTHVEVNDDGTGRESLLLVVSVRARDRPPLSLAPLPTTPRAGPPGPAPHGDALAFLGARPSASRGEGVPDNLGLMEIGWRTSWGALGLPATVASALTPIEVPPGPPAGRAGLRDEHTPWCGTWHSAGVVAARPAQGDDPGCAAMLVLQDTHTTPTSPVLGLFFDADGDAGLVEGLGPDALATLAQRAREGRLPVELGLFLCNDTWMAAYPSHAGDTSLGHVRVADPLAPHRAAYRHDLGPTGWSRRPTAGPWLSTKLVPAIDASQRRRLTAALRALGEDAQHVAPPGR